MRDTDEAIAHHRVLDPSIALLEEPFTPGWLLPQAREVLRGAAP
jgi:hypothetical protein